MGGLLPLVISDQKLCVSLTGFIEYNSARCKHVKVNG